MIWVISAFAVYVLLSGLFSGSEIALYSVNRLRLRSRVEAGWRGAHVLHGLLEKPDTTVMAILIGNNITIYAVSALATELLGAHQHAELLAALLVTPIIFTFGEMLPKDFFRRKADAVMYSLAGPLDALRFLFLPVVVVLRALASLVTRFLPAEQRGTVFSRAALREWLAEGHREGALSGYQHTLAANVMGLLKTAVSSAMVPLNATTTLRAELAGDDLNNAVKQASHSRLPVFSGPEKRIVGILHTLDYICLAEQNPSAGELVREAVKVKHTDGITAVLFTLQRERQQMAIVINDEDEPIGIVTVKDLVEEIVGELKDF